jgi:hypothetical protein
VVCQVHTVAGNREHTKHDICGCALFQRVHFTSMTVMPADDISPRIRPGHGKANLNDPASIAYNRATVLQTVRWAMVDWLKDDHRGGLWEVCSFRCIADLISRGGIGCYCFPFHYPP